LWDLKLIFHNNSIRLQLISESSELLSIEERKSRRIPISNRRIWTQRPWQYSTLCPLQRIGPILRFWKVKAKEHVADLTLHRSSNNGLDYRYTAPKIFLLFPFTFSIWTKQ
jgi:hypothetical protein